MGKRNHDAQTVQQKHQHPFNPRFQLYVNHRNEVHPL